MVQFIEIYDNEDQDELHLPDFNSVPDILDHEPSTSSSSGTMPSSIVPSSPAMYRSDFAAAATTSTTASSSSSPPPPSTLSSTVEKSRETLMSEIEDTIEQMFASIAIGELCKLPMTSKPLPQRKRKRPSPADTAPSTDVTANGPSVASSNDTTRYLSLSSSCNKTRALARHLSVLQMIYEAVAYKIMLTKRDMYYRNVELFGKQSVLDIIVDDISRHFNVPRSSLNVSAASKGLMFGPIIIKLKTTSCSTAVRVMILQTQKMSRAY
ncbi:unnamed protein product [Mucor fragilis]